MKYLRLPSISCIKLASVRRRNLFTFLIIFTLCIYSLFYIFDQDYSGHISCYDIQLSGGVIDILDDVDPPPKGKSIFFHETSCKNKDNWTLMINSRQACAIESAARHNPNYIVYVLFTSPIRYPNKTDMPDRNQRIVHELMKYPNIKIRRVNLKQYTKNTPLEEWYLTGKLQHSYFPISHASDILRYLSLWKYGGIYLDLDVVVMKNFQMLGPNFAGAESLTDVAAGAMGFDHQNEGHEFAEDCVTDLKQHFHGRDWGYNGPGVITRVLKKKCHAKNTSVMTPQRCKGFHVLPPSSFYPIPWKKWALYFNPDKLSYVLNTVRDSFAIHVWNKKSENQTIFTREPTVAYSHIAKEYCPNVFRESGDTF